MISLVADHLWQSTLAGAVCALLAHSLRHNRARVRHALWVVASVKFLVPFALLVGLGHQVSWRTTPRAAEVRHVDEAMSLPVGKPVYFVRRVVATPSQDRSLPEWFVPVGFAVWFGGASIVALGWARQRRRIVRAVQSGRVVESGREFELLRAAERKLAVRTPLPVVECEAAIEPGVFGVIAPVLLWPRGISERLDDSQIEAILDHELAHVRRRDNLVAALQMTVQSLFWFHPGVWWIGARLVDEREHACDEDVVERGREPQVYAESILRTCQFALEAPAVWVSGVTGSDLKKRIQLIMGGTSGRALPYWKKFLLATAGVVAVALPFGVGVWNAPPLLARQQPSTAPLPKFEVASVKLTPPGTVPSRIGMAPGGRFTATNTTLKSLIRIAYQVQEQQLVGGPEWSDQVRFDIAAKAEGDVPPVPIGNVGPMQYLIRSLLAERFGLATHNETRELPVYALVVARSDGKLGPNLKPSSVDCEAMMAAARASGTPPRPPATPDGRPVCGMRMMPGQLIGGGFPVAQLRTSLAQFSQRIVIDRTGLTGPYDIDLKWTPDQMPQLPPGAPTPAIDPDGPSLFTALQEQLGLKLESTRAPVDVLVIDKAEMPVPD